MARVNVVHPSTGARAVEIGAVELVVGRNGCDLEFPEDGQLSRRHGRLWTDQAGTWYEDLGSTNGSFVNGSRLDAPVLLEAGVEVTLSQVRLTLHLAPSSAEPRADVPSGLKVRKEGRSGGKGLGEVVSAAYMSALYEIVELLLTSGGVQNIPQALRQLRKVVQAAQRIAVVAWPPEPDGTFRSLVAGEDCDFISQSLARHAAESGSALLLSDEEVPEGLEMAPSVMHKGICSAIYVPLQEPDKTCVVGLLCVDSPNAYLPLNANHFQFVCAVAGLLATALEAERLREEARQQQLAAQRLEARREGLASFLKIASHDLKNPLHAIVAGAHMLRTVKPERHAKYIKMIEDSASRAHDLIKNYLDVAAVESGHALSVEWSDVEPRKLVEQEMEFLKTALQDNLRSVTLVNGLEDRPIRADARKLQQIFANLIGNAIKYSPAGGEVRVEGGVSAGEARFSVADQGVGITPEDQKRLFGQFQRVGDQAVAPGTGLGLWLTAALVKAHGGTIEVSSVPGQGSTFTFTVPQ